MTEDNCNTKVDPREQCLLDFEQWAGKAPMEEERLIVLADANQSFNNEIKDYNLCDTIENCLLVSDMEAKHAGTSLQSVDRGTKNIDHVLLHGINTADIHRAG